MKNTKNAMPHEPWTAAIREHLGCSSQVRSMVISRETGLGWFPCCPVVPFFPLLGKGSPVKSTNQKGMPLVSHGNPLGIRATDVMRSVGPAFRGRSAFRSFGPPSRFSPRLFFVLFFLFLRIPPPSPGISLRLSFGAEKLAAGAH